MKHKQIYKQQLTQKTERIHKRITQTQRSKETNNLKTTNTYIKHN